MKVYKDNKYYTGIGSRDTPENILKFMELVGEAMATLKYIGRSGGANGADKAFWDGFNTCDKLDKKFECYLPWNNFNGLENSMKHVIDTTRLKNYNEAKEIMKTIHPSKGNMSRGPTAMHTRNMYQVLGLDLQTPSCVLFCYAKPDNKGSIQGGTRSAYELAKRHGIKCYNFYFQSSIDEVEKLLKLN